LPTTPPPIPRNTSSARCDERGIRFIADSNELGFPDFYHAAFHKPSYVMEHWQRWFELLAYIPRNNLDFQDVVVLRPRPAPRSS
jgi:hypothetical protein